MLWTSLKAWRFVLGLLLMLVGTIAQEFVLSKEQGGVVSSPLPIGLLAGIVSGLAVGFLTKDSEVAVFRAFVAGYVGAILGAAVFATSYWGTKPEAGAFGWTIFLLGGLFVGLAIGWLPALAAAGSAYTAASPPGLSRAGTGMVPRQVIDAPERRHTLHESKLRGARLTSSTLSAPTG